MPTPKIAIVGAGPVGCTLARILYLQNIPVTVFEIDQNPNDRGQGSTLDLHPKTGMRALKTAQLFDEFSKTARYDSQYMLMCDKNLNPFIEVGKTGGVISERPEIDRTELRKLLINSLPEGTIKWGHKLKSVEDGNRLVFEHTTEDGFDLVVGCDGAFSKVRNYLSTDRPLEYSGITYHQMLIPNAERTANHVYRLINRGNVFAHSFGKQLSIQQLGDGSVNVASYVARPEDFIKCHGLSDLSLEDTKKLLLEEKSDYCPQLREAIEMAQGSCMNKNLYTLPPGWHWNHRRGATAIGDAAHLMLPFAGEGVNLGMDDAQRLATAIIKAVTNGGSADELDKQVFAYEQEMFIRMELYQSQTAEVTELWFKTPDEKMRTIVPNVLKSHTKLLVPKMLQTPAAALIHTWWFFRERFSQ
ncbi:putative oligopeptide transporter [Xylariaceae sp. FL1019]|nr:putative oligopeptide transporter [Xylariaceae sp. FL1019]